VNRPAPDEGAILAMMLNNPVNRELLRRLPELGLDQAYLTAGCLVQAVWNGRIGAAPGARVRDYDVFYFDADDLSYEAEDRVIRQAGGLFADLGVTVEVRNQARVHYGTSDASACLAHCYAQVATALRGFRWNAPASASKRQPGRFTRRSGWMISGRGACGGTGATPTLRLSRERRLSIGPAGLSLPSKTAL
jgi:hypothetical protein